MKMKYLRTIGRMIFFRHLDSFGAKFYEVIEGWQIFYNLFCFYHLFTS